MHKEGGAFLPVDGRPRICKSTYSISLGLGLVLFAGAVRFGAAVFFAVSIALSGQHPVPMVSRAITDDVSIRLWPCVVRDDCP